VSGHSFGGRMTRGAGGGVTGCAAILVLVAGMGLAGGHGEGEGPPADVADAGRFTVVASGDVPVAGLAVSEGTAAGESATPEGVVGMANPAAVYCTELGYDFAPADGSSGQGGVCSFPSGEQCDAWEFLQGKCGRPTHTAPRWGTTPSQWTMARIRSHRSTRCVSRRGAGSSVRSADCSI